VVEPLPTKNYIMLIILKASLIDFQCIFVEIHNMHGFSWVLVYEVLLKIFMLKG
jgi:hypothetical protein